MSTRAWSGVALAAVLCVSVLAGCANSAPPARPAVTLSFCGSGPQPAPAVVQVICNTDDLTARNLAWSGWGASTATASGVGVVDLCAYEDCHTGAFGAVSVRLIASKIAPCGAGKRAYTMLRYEFTGGSPWAGVPADMKTSNYIAGANRTLPPPDQTVALACG
ncbi:MAG TPA: hypothetical protein VHZ33_34260 [Trebonia sp.]|jgi:hypothetical protein|nr:hypothetical protein [Trebonia sp.]